MKKTRYNIGRSYIVLLASLPLLLLMVRCEIQPDFEYESSNQGGELGMTAWEYIQQSDSLSLMEEAVNAAGLSGLYSSSEAKTFIIPRNSAFRDYFKTNSISGVSEIPVADLQDMLKYHIVKAAVNFQNVELFDVTNDSPNAYDTENGEIMYLSHNSNYQVVINYGTNKSWTVITSNLEPTNGVIHITKDVVYLSL